MAPDGRNQTLLVDVPSGWGAHRPTWSPDETEIAFQTDPKVSGLTSTLEIYKAVVATGQLIRLTSNRTYDGNPDWSPILP